MGWKAYVGKIAPWVAASLLGMFRAPWWAIGACMVIGAAQFALSLLTD